MDKISEYFNNLVQQQKNENKIRDYFERVSQVI